MLIRGLRGTAQICPCSELTQAGLIGKLRTDYSVKDKHIASSLELKLQRLLLTEGWADLE